MEVRSQVQGLGQQCNVNALPGDDSSLDPHVHLGFILMSIVREFHKSSDAVRSIDQREASLLAGLERFDH